MFLLAVLLGACETDDGPGRVLLIGIDGATLRVTTPMLERGDLPNLGRIAQAGVAGPLRAHLPLRSPRIWTSIATGKLPRKHRVTGFARRAGRGNRRLFVSSDRRGPAIWNIASEAGLTVAVVNWWTTYPVEKIRGVMISDHLLASRVQEQVRLTGARDSGRGPVLWPPEWQPRVEELLARSEPLTGIPDPVGDLDPPPGWTPPEALSRYYREDESVARIALAVEQELRPDLLMVFLPGIDRVSHHLWAGMEPPSAYPSGPAVSEPVRKWNAQVLFRYYAFTDALIGRLAAGYGPRDLIMIVSDHGFEAGTKFAKLTGVHETARAIDGVIFARGPGIRPVQGGERISVNDVTPTILAWLGLPTSKAMDGRVAGIFDGPRVPPIPAYRISIERLSEVPSGSEEQMLERLRSLGYLESEEPD